MNFLFVDLLHQGQYINSDYFLENIMNPTIQRFQEITGRKIVKLNLINCRVHNSKKSNLWYQQNRIIRLLHPSYNLDLAPSDFFLFGYMNEKLSGRSFDNPITDIINSIPKEIII